jgi:glycine cleavage system H protein
MKSIDELFFPADLRYTESHEWVGTEGEIVKVGLSDYAQDQLGDVVFVELPEIGESISRGAEFGTVESVKAVSEIYMPVGGEIVAINPALENSPELVNTDPYIDGWMIAIRPVNSGEMDDLLNSNAYLEKLKG